MALPSAADVLVPPAPFVPPDDAQAASAHANAATAGGERSTIPRCGGVGADDGGARGGTPVPSALIVRSPRTCQTRSSSSVRATPIGYLGVHLQPIRLTRGRA